MYVTYRYRLCPTPKQEEAISWTCKGVRFLYNRLLEDRTESFRQTGRWEKLTSQHYRELTWLLRVDPFALQAAENQLSDAYEHFFYLLRSDKENKYRPEALERAKKDASYKLTDCDLIGYPKIKSGSVSSESYQTDPRCVELKDNRVCLPRVGEVKIVLHRPLPDGARIQRSTVMKKKSGHYYLLLLLEVEDTPKKASLDRPLGVAFEPGKLVVRSDEKEVAFRHMDPALEERIQKAYQTLRRRKPGSKRYEKQRRYLAGLYEKRVEQRRDDLHKAARSIAMDADVVSMEAPEVLSRAGRLKTDGQFDLVRDEAWWKFGRLVEQKVSASGGTFFRLQRRDASLAVCAVCAVRESRPDWNKKMFQCRHCGRLVPRSENTAKVLEQLSAGYIEQRKE